MADNTIGFPISPFSKKNCLLDVFQAQRTFLELVLFHLNTFEGRQSTPRFQGRIGIEVWLRKKAVLVLSFAPERSYIAVFLHIFNSFALL